MRGTRCLILQPETVIMRASSFVISIVAFVIVASAWAEPTTQPSDIRTPDAKTIAAYDRIKALAGQWEGKSTKGWTEILDIEVLAKGSCVMEKSRFAHGDNDGMVTMFHLDGPDLLLTHYCMARNQPRLKATEISDDGKTLLFTFLDGTNMASRDVGHMDKVRIEFGDDPNEYKAQWTFYAKGKEQWMEAITFKRIEKKETAGK
jgi:hypothetical protein